LTNFTSQSSSLNVIYGLYIGNFSTIVPILTIAFTVLLSDINYGIYGLAISSFGMLLNLPVILSFQIFGPISDVSLGIINMIGFRGETNAYINQLDIIGNTMSAVVKGYSCGAAGLVSFGLYGALMLSKHVIYNNIDRGNKY
jgi:Na+/H+-translocating membrane pyrophosphatase